MAEETGMKEVVRELNEIKKEVAEINRKYESNYKWLPKLTKRLLPISLFLAAIEISILLVVAVIIYFGMKFFVFSDAGRSILKFIL
ncbi:hypothetical protein ACFL58_02830 [Elusimicrobiota bacterium]